MMIMDNKIIKLDIEKFRLPNNYIESHPKPPKRPSRQRWAGTFLKALS